MKSNKILRVILILAIAFVGISCEDLEKYEPLGENSIPDATPPQANFSATGGVTIDDFLEFNFANLSTTQRSAFARSYQELKLAHQESPAARLSESHAR